jgi:hypothetical protein
VVIAAADPFVAQVADLFRFSDDTLGGAFGYAGPGGDISRTNIRVLT